MGSRSSRWARQQSWEYKAREEQRKAALPTFYKEVEQLTKDNDIEALSHHMWSTNQSEKAEAAARALSQIGSDEARETLLQFVAFPQPLNYVVWPYAIPFLAEDDAPWLLEIDKKYSRSPRMAAKYKLPVEAQELIVQYLQNNIGGGTEEVLMRAIYSRYREVDNTVFELLLEHDSPDIRKALAWMVQGQGDWRKKDKRAMLAFKKLLPLVKGDEYKELLRDACGSSSKPVAEKAADMLTELDSEFLLDMIRKKSYLSAIDIRKLGEEGSPESIERIAREGWDISPWLLSEGASQEEQEAFIALFEKARSIRNKKIRTSIIEPLCENFAYLGIRAAFPSMKKVANSVRRMKLVDKERTAIRKSSYASWRGMEALKVCLNILYMDRAYDEEVGIIDHKHPYAIKACRIIKDAEGSLVEIDEFVGTLRDPQYEELESLLRSYWNIVGSIESDIAEMLKMLGKDKFSVEDDPTLHHSFRIIERADFSYSSYDNRDVRAEFLKALNTIGEVDTEEERKERALVTLLERASSARYITSFTERIITVCRLVSERNIKRALAPLKELALSIDDSKYEGYWDERFEIKVAVCRTILDLEGISPRNRTNTFAKMARKAIEKYSKLVEERGNIWMHADISDGKADEADFYSTMKGQLFSMEDILSNGFSDTKYDRC